MKEFKTEDIRNIGLVGHMSVGKTSLAEAMLFSAGETTRLGNVTSGTTVSDYRPEEIDRKFSIGASLMNVQWKEKKLNIIDAPGYLDFIGEVKCTLRVADIAVILIDAINGVEVGSEIAWQNISATRCGCIVLVNRENKEHANFDKAFDSAQQAFGSNVTVVTFPTAEGENFTSVINVLTMKMLTFNKDTSGKFNSVEIPAEFMDRATELHERLVEMAAESDDELLEKFFAAGELTPEELAKGLTKGIATRNIIPIFAGAADTNIGIQALMNFIADYGPSPMAFSPVENADGSEKRKVSSDEPFSGVIFKTVSEPHVGELSYIRIFSGVLKTGDEVLNVNGKHTEKIGQIYLVNGKARKEIGNLYAGDIGALVKLKDSHTGDTLANKRQSILYPGIVFPKPVSDVAIIPKNKGDEERISNGLHVLNEIDRSFSVVHDQELHQTIIYGQGELHLETLIQRLRDRFNVEVDQKKPKIPYRETITGKADEKYRHKKQTGGAGQFAEVWMRVEPLERSAGFEFENDVFGGAISSSFIPSIEKGVRQILVEGAIAGYPLVDVKAIVYDGKEHPVDSKDIAFQIAGREVFKMCVKSAKPILIEPIFNIEVKIPEDFMGDVMGDLSSRRGRIIGMGAEGKLQVIKAQVPLAELYKYSAVLRSITQGRGIYTRELSHYEPMPKEIEARVIEEARVEKEASK